MPMNVGYGVARAMKRKGGDPKRSKGDKGKVVPKSSRPKPQPAAKRKSGK